MDDPIVFLCVEFQTKIELFHNSVYKYKHLGSVYSGKWDKGLILALVPHVSSGGQSI